VSPVPVQTSTIEQQSPLIETTTPDIVLPSSTSSRSSSRQSSRSNSSRNHSSEVAAAFPSTSLSIQPVLCTPRISPPSLDTHTPRHTPRHDLSLPLHNIVSFESNVPYTPTGEEADLYKYYCPLCMLYYQSILKSKCCNNYLCIFCTKDYLITKHIIDKKKYENKETLTVEFLDEITDNVLMNEINCPHCIRKGFSIIKVSRHEEVRDYSMKNNPGVGSYQLNAASPVRIGESFEELKRKMIPFRINNNDNIVKNADKFASSPTSINEMISPLVTAYARVSSFRNASDNSPIVNATPLLLNALLLNDDEIDREDYYSPARSERLIATGSTSARIRGIAMLDFNEDNRREGNGSPLLSPQSTYRSRGNSPTHHVDDELNRNDRDYYDLSVTSAAGDSFSPSANLFARTAPMSARREDSVTPQRGGLDERRRSRNEDRVYYHDRLSESVDELSESVESGLVGMRIAQRMEHSLLARDIVQDVFSTAFSHRTIEIQ
jgi:hypothetical protein